jgi:hypothetical protein
MAASSAAVEEPKSGFAVDPMMAEDENSPAAKARRSFSDLSEMPPLKEVYVAPPPPPPSTEAPAAAEPLPQVVFNKSQDEKPKIQVREAAQKAVSEIRGTPPKLYLYAVGAALLVIALILVGMSMASYWQDRESDSGSAVAPTTAETQSSPVPQAPQQPVPAPPAQAAAAPPDNGNATSSAQPQAAAEAPEQASEAPASSRSERGRKMKSHAVAAAPVLAQLTVSSNPAGVQIVFDGSPLCVTPCTLTGIAPGQHTILASKSGYSSANRNIVLSSGANTTISMNLSAASAKLSVASNPAGATILVDGQDTGKLSPAQFLFNTPGAHTVVLRRYGYLDEATTVNAEGGQTATVNLVLKPLGNTDEIRTAGGHFKPAWAS